MADIKFISYDGKWPNLCSGTLIVELEGTQYEINHAMQSGGSVYFTGDWDAHVETGEWDIYEECLPKKLRKYRQQIKDLVNDNIEHGCCGGCI